MIDLPFHEVANLFPLIEGKEFDELVEDIRQNGLHQAIWTYQEQIIDGRNRYRACLQANIPPHFQEWNGQGSLTEFVVSLNIKRRHLTKSQLAAIALGTIERLANEAKERQKKAGGDKVSVFAPAVPQNFEEPLEQKGESAQFAANLLNTNRDYVITAKKIEVKAPELIPHIIEGTLTIPDAKAIAPLAPKRRQAVIQKAIQRKEEEGKRVSRTVKDAIIEEEIQEKRERLAEEAKHIVPPESIRLLPPGDFREMHQEIDDESIDMIFTDPPYHEEHLALWSDLSILADRVLKPGGIFLAYSGQIFLPDVLNALSQHLTYRWLLGVAHTGGHIQIWKHLLWNDWKPIVWFSKGKTVDHEWLMDLYRGEKGDKVAHEWAQGEGEAAYYIEKLTKPGQSILDPMCGSGTILRAAHKLGRKSIGMEKDEMNHAIVLSGMKELV